jgi:hypothetical protein
MKKAYFLCLAWLLACQAGQNDPSPVEITLDSVVAGNAGAEVLGEVLGGQALDELGVVWATRPGPTLADTKLAAPLPQSARWPLKLQLTGLVNGQSYHVRAFARQGEAVIYSEEFSITPQASTRWRALASLVDPGNLNVDLARQTTEPTDNPLVQRKVGGQEIFQAWFYVRNQNEWFRAFNGEAPALYEPFGFALTSEAGTRYTYTGGGYQLRPQGLVLRRQYVRTVQESGPGGSFPIADYPGADVPATGLANPTNSRAYVLENGGEHRLWQLTDGRWQALSRLPVPHQGRILGWVLGGRYFYLLEPSELGTQAPALWEYLPGPNAWQRRADFAGEPRRDGLAFAAQGTGYYGTGQAVGQPRGLKDLWAYSPATDRWQRATDYPGSGSVQLFAQPTGAGTRVYVGLGFGVRPQPNGAASYPSASDFWELTL